MKKSILAFSFLFSVGLLVFLGSREKAEAQVNKGPRPKTTPMPIGKVIGTPALGNPRLPFILKKTGTPVPNFTLPANLGKVLPAPKKFFNSDPRPVVKGLELLPQDPGDMANSKKLPKGAGLVSAMDFNKALAKVLFKKKTDIKLADLAQAKSQPQALLIQKNIQAQFKTAQWFMPKWWVNNPCIFASWSYFTSYQLFPYWYWYQTPHWAACNLWLVYQWADPFYHECGVNVAYRNGWVYAYDVAMFSVPLWAYHAHELARVEPPAPEAELKYTALGMYVLCSSRNEIDPSVVLQLAVTPEGIISGTMFNSSTGVAVAVSGKVEPETQRVAIELGEKGPVLETFFYNLTLWHTCVWLHHGYYNTETRFLVRIPALPKE